MCESDRKVIGIDDSEVYKSRLALRMRGESKYTLYGDVHIYLKPVVQEIDALGNSWRLKRRRYKPCFREYNSNSLCRYYHFQR